MAQGLDPEGSETVMLYVCKHVTVHIVNNRMSVGFGQQCVGVALATECVLLHLWLLLFVFNIVHVMS